MSDEITDSFLPDPVFVFPHVARIWNYWLGGKDNFEPDIKAGNLAARLVPHLRNTVLHSRAFLHRAVHHLASNEGITQFLDVGAGLPVVDRTHEVAQAAAPGARVVYVDNDPLVLAHTHANIAGSRDTVDVVNADARDAETILDEAALTLDLDRPVGLLMLGVLSHLTKDRDAHEAVAGLVAGLAPGSHLVIAHPTDHLDGDLMHDAMRVLAELGSTPTVPRTAPAIEQFFTDLHLYLLSPGVVPCSHWQPDPGPWKVPPVPQFCGVARIVR